MDINQFRKYIANKAPNKPLKEAVDTATKSAVDLLSRAATIMKSATAANAEKCHDLVTQSYAALKNHPALAVKDTHLHKPLSWHFISLIQDIEDALNDANPDGFTYIKSQIDDIISLLPK